VIVTDNLQQATPAASATAFRFDGEFFEHGSTTGMFTDPIDERPERELGETFG